MIIYSVDIQRSLVARCSTTSYSLLTIFYSFLINSRYKTTVKERFSGANLNKTSILKILKFNQFWKGLGQNAT